MIKVLHLINYPGKGGSESYIMSLAQKMHNKSCIFYVGYSMYGPMIEKARDLGIKTLNIPMKSPWDLRAAVMLKSVCEEFGIDLVHTHFLRENYISVISKIIGNKVVLINTCHLLDKKSIPVRLSNVMASFFVDGIIAVSNAVKKQMEREGISPSLIKVIHNGVDMDYWKSRRNYKIREALGLSKDDFVITSVARFSEEKSHTFLLETIRILKKIASSGNIQKIKKIKFLLVGDGELLEECKNFADLLGISDITIFTDYRSDVMSILRGSNLFVSHSKSEAFSISILEALACGLPVIATNVGGSSEVINDDTRCGLLVEHNDVEGFAEAIIKMVTDRNFYNLCRKNSVMVVKEKFSLDKTVEETYNLYNKCLTDKRGDVS